jgi:hypothetical protein
MRKIRLQGRVRFVNVIMVTVACLFIFGLVAGALYALICGNQYFTEEEVLAIIKEKNPYVVGLFIPPRYRIFEPSLVTTVDNAGKTEDYQVYSNIKRVIRVE